MSKNKIKASVVGATGYTGLELIKLLLEHPQVTIESLISRSKVGLKISETLPAFYNSDLIYKDFDLKHLETSDIVFFATPHKVALTSAPDLIKKGINVIDLGADFRLTNKKLQNLWYDLEANEAAIYGLVELNRQKIKDSAKNNKARLIANPGCYTTSSILALAPALKSGLVEIENIIIDAKSGTSGAGRKENINLLLSESYDNFYAYASEGHRHLPEIYEQLLNFIPQEQHTQFDLTFNPHILPMSRGIECSIYLQLKSGANFDDLYSYYNNFYKNERFVHLLEAGQTPQTKMVRGTNNCVLGLVSVANSFKESSKRVIISSVIDNLLKGAAGQALQNMNIIFDLPESTGLTASAIYP